MSEGFSVFALGLWLGLTLPLAVHVMAANVSQRSLTLSRILRFLIAPAALLGLLGMAAALGQKTEFANWGASGTFLGLALYGLCAWLKHRHSKAEHS